MNAKIETAEEFDQYLRAQAAAKGYADGDIDRGVDHIWREGSLVVAAILPLLVQGVSGADIAANIRNLSARYTF